MKTPRSLCGVASCVLLPSLFTQLVNGQSSLFPSELVQLNDADLSAEKDQAIAALFKFGDSSPTEALAHHSCKVFPGDVHWPGVNIWETFNRLLDGALIKTAPPAASCYVSWPGYDDAECDYIASQWGNSYWHAADPISIMSPVFEGLSCEPTDDPSGSCTQGGYPIYAVNISTVAQIQLAINFARNTGIRLVVKNTGHDFNGKSAGAGALGVWTHHLKDIKYYDSYTSKSYTGPAVKVGAGIQAYELYEAANAHGVTVVGGEGRTVGIAGGYVAGGGHSPLSSLYGLGVDQVLAMEVVLPSGRFVSVTEEQNSDLFWALRGGGGSTFGVVTSVVFRAYPKIGVTVSTFSFSNGDGVSVETFWAGVRAYYDRFIVHADAGTYAYFWLLANGNDSYSFVMQPFFAVNHTLEQFNTLTKPWFDQLKTLGIPVAPNSTYYDNFYDGWWAGFPLEAVGTETSNAGSRLFPRANWEDEMLLNRTFAVHRNTVTAGYPILSFNMKADAAPGTPENAANPAFREMLMHAITFASWTEGASHAEMLASMTKMTDEILGPWRAVCPGSGAYMSEADILEPNFQQTFYGSNYDRLYRLKQEYDPSGLFYAPTGVGSEDWVVKSVNGLPDQNGRLCRV